MLKFQFPMFNDVVCKAATDKQKHTYRVKTEETFFPFIIFVSLIHLKIKKVVSNIQSHRHSGHKYDKKGFLHQHGNRIPIILETRTRKHPLTFDEAKGFKESTTVSHSSDACQ